MLNIASSLRTILAVVMSISALASLVFAVLYMTRGERDAASKMWMLLIGYGIGVALISILPGGSIDGIAEGAEMDLGGIRKYISQSLQAVLSLVSMVGLTLNAIKVMQGDAQSLRRFFTWLAVTVVGIGLLQVFQ